MAITEQGNGKESRDDAAARTAATPASTAGPATDTVEAADATDAVAADGASAAAAARATGAAEAGVDGTHGEGAAGMDAGRTADTTTDADADADADMNMDTDMDPGAADAAGTARSRRPSVPLTYRDLLVEPRLRPWAQRVGVGLLAGLFVALFFGWRGGFTVMVMVVVADTVRRTRMQSSVDAWQKKASSAERRTERQLRFLEKKHGYRILHARAVPRDDEGVSDGKIDHLVIGPSGVYAIDSEKWDKRLPVRTLSHRKLFHGPFNKKDRLDEARWEADQASKTLSAAVGFEVPVQPSVAIYGPAIPWKVMTVRDVDVYSGGRAKSYLRRRPRIMTESDVQRIYKVALMTLPPVHGHGQD